MLYLTHSLGLGDYWCLLLILGRLPLDLTSMRELYMAMQLDILTLTQIINFLRKLLSHICSIAFSSTDFQYQS